MIALDISYLCDSVLSDLIIYIMKEWNSIKMAKEWRRPPSKFCEMSYDFISSSR